MWGQIGHRPSKTLLAMVQPTSFFSFPLSSFITSTTNQVKQPSFGWENAQKWEKEGKRRRRELGVFIRRAANGPMVQRTKHLEGCGKVWSRSNG
jgi:hypothetical protein